MNVGPKVDRAVAAIEALYERHCVGGSLHIVTDDYNVTDGDVAFCRRWMDERGADEVEWAALRALEACTEPERLSAIARYWGDYPVFEVSP